MAALAPVRMRWQGRDGEGRTRDFHHRNNNNNIILVPTTGSREEEGGRGINNVIVEWSSIASGGLDELSLTRTNCR